MEFYWVKTHQIVKKIFSNYIWDIPNNDKTVYLTFDDGPTPAITEWVLNQLEIYGAKATFFCIGKNIKAHPSLFKKILKADHAVGNHTFNHLNGWKFKTADYVKNCLDLKALNVFGMSNLFRPPYGKIKLSQSKILRNRGYKIIMWDVLSADFDHKISSENCYQNVVSNIQSGSIVVFHDSKKAFKHLEYALPRVLSFLNQNGYKCEAIKF